MSWPNPFRRRDENTRTCWGYTFQLTPDHLTLETAHPLKFSYDTLGEKALERLNEISPPPPRAQLPRNKNIRDSEGDHTPLQPLQKVPDATCSIGSDEAKGPSHDESSQTKNEKPSEPPKPPARDLYRLLEEHASKDAVLNEMWSQVNHVPEWVDWDQIERGQNVFYRYGGPCIVGLAFQSLLGGMGAHRVVEVLARTGGFSTKVARHRLFETTQHLLQCTTSLSSIQPGGAGFQSSIRVRLLHAAVRQRIMTLARTHPSYYDVEAFGIPINDLDCVATIATFSATLIWIALPRQGIIVREQEAEDYVALWRYVAYLTGTPSEHFSTPERARVMMESLLMNEINPTKTSGVLANNVINALEGEPPGYASKEFLEANSRWLNGNELCDALDLGRPGYWYWVLVASQNLFFMITCYTSRCFESSDRRKIAASKHFLWKLVVESEFGLGKPTAFDFKHVPELEKTTLQERGEKQKARNKGVERRNLRTLVVVLPMLGFMVVVGCKCASIVLRSVSSQVSGFLSI